MGEGRNMYRVLVGKPEGKRPLESPRRRWEDGIKMDLKETGSWGLKWIHLAQNRDRRQTFGFRDHGVSYLTAQIGIAVRACVFRRPTAG
jgi:hypothetical protein